MILKIFILFFNLLFSNQLNETNKIPLYNFDGVNYISAQEYSEIQNIRTIFYDDKEKLEFRYQIAKLVISPYSSFIKINEKVYHMYLPIIFDGIDFYIPIEPFGYILSK